MNTKQFSEVKVSDAGQIVAVFATLGVIDHDGDVTKPGAFENGAKVRLSAFNHSSWGTALPVGKGTIREQGNEAVLTGQFFMNTSHGKDTFTTVKELGDLAEWSYGFDVVESSKGTQDGQDVQFLEKLKVHEVSPVILGAGIATRTLSMKDAATTGTDADEYRLAQWRVMRASPAAHAQASIARAKLLERMRPEARLLAEANERIGRAAVLLRRFGDG